MTVIRLLSSSVTRHRAARRILVLLATGCAAGGVAHPQQALAQRDPKSETLQPPRFFMLRDAGSRPVRVDVAAVPVLQRRVRLELDGVSRKAALAEIARQSGLRLFYVDNVIDATAPVQLRASAITVAGALGAVLSGVAIDVILAPDGSATLVRQGRTQSSSQAGTIVGEVIDAATHAPVEDVRVEVVGTSVTTRTNADGVFRLLSVPAGVVALRTHAVGFAPLVRTDVAVSTAKPVQVTLALHRIAVALEQVTVRPNYFEIAFDAPTSTHRLNAEEIRRAPGAQEDVVRAIAVLPGVAPTHLPRNDIIVRGGAPFENLFVVDNLEVPNINHVGAQGSSGGLVSLLNLDFIQQADFSAGAFGARHGNRAGSVTSLALRDGSTERHSGQANLASTGFGLAAEGPLGKGSYLIGVRRSYLDLVFQAIDEPFAIGYWDAQARVTQRLGRRDALSWTFGGATDNFDINNETADNRYENASVMSIGQDQYFTSLTWSRWSARSLLQVTAGRVFTAFSTWQNDSMARRVFENESSEDANSLAIRLTHTLTPRLSIEAGTLAQYSGDLRYDVDLPGSLRRDSAGAPSPLRVDTSFTAWRLGGHAQVGVRWTPRLQTTLGIRADYYDYGSDALRAAPRLSTSFDAGGGYTLTLAGGRYWQAPSFIWLVGDARNRDLRPFRADHAVVGVQKLLREDTKLQVEAYYKRYASYPARVNHPQAVLSASGFEDVHADVPFGLEPLTSAGKGRSYGAELLVQKRLSEVPIYGLVTISANHSEFAGLDGVWRRGAFDSPFVGNFALGWRPDQRWDLGLRFRVATGRPTTPFITSGPLEGTPDFSRVNEGDRFPAFHSLDLRIDRRWTLPRAQLTTYLDIQDVYNRNNPFAYAWDFRDRQPEWDRALGILPSVGIRLDF